MVGEQKFKLRAFKCKSLVPFLQSRDLNKIKLIHFFSILKLHNYNCSIVGCSGCKQTTLMCIWAYNMSKYCCMIVRFSINHTFSPSWSLAHISQSIQLNSKNFIFGQNLHLYTSDLLSSFFTFNGRKISILDSQTKNCLSINTGKYNF